MPPLRPICRLLPLAACLVAVLALPAQQGRPGAQGGAPQEKEPPPPTPLSEAATEAICVRYAQGEHWVQKVVTLLSLNQWWHPAGSAMILDALQDKDERLNAYAVEALLRSDEGLLPCVASAELIDELIGKQLRDKNELYSERVAAALARIAPQAGAQDERGWPRWWRDAKETWKPAPWKPREQPKNDGRGTSAAAAQRAFDLYQYGLDMVLCIDSTGSMQPTIDAVAEALGEMVDILDGISPKMRLAIVHYKDHGELGDEGAKLLQPFTKSVRQAKKSLEKLTAFGGGDAPEAVLGGLELAYDHRQMKWKKDANKLVVLIGDAPPHADEAGRAVEAARNARENPGGDPRRPTTGTKTDERPILTSAIAVIAVPAGSGMPTAGGGRPRVRPNALTDFVEIAEAGGGVYVQVAFTVRRGPAPGARDRDRERAKGSSQASMATRRVVEHILVLSFGERFRREMRDFTRIFFEYKDAGFID